MSLNIMKNKEETGTSTALLAGLEPHPRFSRSIDTPDTQPLEISECVPEKLKGCLPDLSRRQWLLIAVFAAGNLIAGIVYNIKGPFYPAEAEKKGVTSTQYGFVFGIFELTKVVVCPFYGKYMSRLGPRRVFISAMMLIGICSICFGLLDNISNSSAFLTLSLILRVFEALGSAGFSTASFTIIACEYPDAIGKTFAVLETFFGLGLTVGPLLGGILFELGGYPVPFIVTGFVLFFLAFVVMSIMPQPETSVLDQDKRRNSQSVFSLLKIPGIFLAAFGVFAAASSTGFINATLEPHIRQFNLTPVEVGVVFIIYGSVYALTAPIWGWICDRVSQPKLITLCGAAFNFVAFLLIGPAPFFQFDSILWLTCIGLVLHGLALGATFVSGFVLSLKYSVANGFPNDMATYGLVSGMWTTILSLGMFIGPSFGGILLDQVGFRWGSVFVLVAMTILIALITLFLMKNGLHIIKSDRSLENLILISEAQPLLPPIANPSPKGYSSVSNNDNKQPSYGYGLA